MMIEWAEEAMVFPDKTRKEQGEAGQGGNKTKLAWCDTDVHDS